MARKGAATCPAKSMAMQLQLNSTKPRTGAHGPRDTLGSFWTHGEYGSLEDHGRQIAISCQ